MADIKISELGAASAVNSTDIFPMTSAGITVKATAQQLKNYMGVGNLSDLNTTDKTSSVNAINEVDSHTDIVQAQVSNSGDAYDPTKPYAVNELCIHDDVLYRCTTPCSAGSWVANQSCFTADTLTSAMSLRAHANWKLAGVYDVTTTQQDINIPNNTNEILIVIGEKNDQQVYGGKSCIIPMFASERNIIVTGQLINGTGTILSDKGAYLYAISYQHILKAKMLDVKTTPIIMRLYYR